ncbi:hypothetical protein OG871_40340 (plasmid) [Kitasatospora sp. NBC_00374]
MTEQPQDFEGDDNDPVISHTELPGQRPPLPLPGSTPWIPAQARGTRPEG